MTNKVTIELDIAEAERIAAQSKTVSEAVEKYKEAHKKWYTIGPIDEHQLGLLIKAANEGVRPDNSVEVNNILTSAIETKAPTKLEPISMALFESLPIGQRFAVVSPSGVVWHGPRQKIGDNIYRHVFNGSDYNYHFTEISGLSGWIVRLTENGPVPTKEQVETWRKQS